MTYMLFIKAVTARRYQMTTEDKKAIIKFIKFRYINYISNRQIDGLIDLSDEMSIKHPHYDALEACIKFACERSQLFSECIDYLGGLKCEG